MRRIVPIIVEKKIEEVRKTAGSDITMSKGMLALGLIAAALGGLVIGIFISPKGAKVQNVSGDRSRDAIDDFNDLWFDEDEEEYEDDDADELTESNELNGNRSKFIKL